MNELEAFHASVGFFPQNFILLPFSYRRIFKKMSSKHCSLRDVKINPSTATVP